MTNFELNLQLFAAATPTVGTYGITNLQKTTTADLSFEMKEFYDTALLENARAKLVYAQFGKKQALPGGNGKTVEWRRVEPFAPTTTALVEGEIPAATNAKVAHVTTTVAQYGAYTAVSDLLDFMSVDPLISEITLEHSAAMANSLDILVRNKVCATATYAMAQNSSGVPAGNKAAYTTATYKDYYLKSKDVAKVRTMLQQKNVPTIDGYYVCITHPSCAHDLRNDPDWISVHQYAATKEIFNGEIGELHGVRFVVTTNALCESSGAASNPVKCYYNTFFGKDAWGVVEPTGESARMIVKPASEAGGPLEQWSTVGWKALTGSAVLYSDRVINLITTSSFSESDEAN